MKVIIIGKGINSTIEIINELKMNDKDLVITVNNTIIRNPEIFNADTMSVENARMFINNIKSNLIVFTESTEKAKDLTSIEPVIVNYVSEVISYKGKLINMYKKPTIWLVLIGKLTFEQRVEIRNQYKSVVVEEELIKQGFAYNEIRKSLNQNMIILADTLACALLCSAIYKFEYSGPYDESFEEIPLLNEFLASNDDKNVERGLINAIDFDISSSSYKKVSEVPLEEVEESKIIKTPSDIQKDNLDDYKVEEVVKTEVLNSYNEEELIGNKSE